MTRARAFSWLRCRTAASLCLLVACNAGSESSPARDAHGHAASEALPTAPAAQAPEAVFRRARTMMGTLISITVVGEQEAKAANAVDAAFREMERLEATLSEWRPDSEISQINAAAGEKAVKVGDDTLAVVRAGLEVSRWSEGAFDLSWAALHGLYMFQEDNERIPSQEELGERLPLIDYHKIELDEAAHTVRLAKAGMKIGTGGIAKGYSLDRAAATLRAAGVQNFMLFGGGQVQVSGKREGRAWRVGIQHPRKNDYFAFLEAHGGSISTSGDYEHAFIRNGKRWHHILDLRTGMPIEHTASVTVLADSGLYADALSTAVFVLGAERALARLPKAPGNAQAVIVDADMRLHVSPALESKLVMRATLKDGRLPL